MEWRLIKFGGNKMEEQYWEFDKKFWMFGWMNITREQTITVGNIWYVRIFGGLYIQFI